MPSLTKILCCTLLALTLTAPPGGAAGAGSPSPTDLHIRFTTPRPQTADCLKRGQDLIDALKKELEKYKDYKAGEAAGYAGYYTQSALPMYHFASKWRAFKELVRFDPIQPTALLYKKAG